MNHNLSTLQVVAILRLRDGKYLFRVKISKICIVPDFFFFFLGQKRIAMDLTLECFFNKELESQTFSSPSRHKLGLSVRLGVAVACGNLFVGLIILFMDQSTQKRMNSIF